MEQGSVRRVLAAALIIALGCVVCQAGLAKTPQQYRQTLSEVADSYSGARIWRSVVGQLRADEAYVVDGEGEFKIVDELGNASLATDSARMSISGEVRDGSIVKLEVSVTPVDSATREFEYQAFSLSEIAFKSLLSRKAMRGDMSAYLFLYDIYPYAMWANDSVLGDSSRSVTTALGGVVYSITANSSSSARSVDMTIEVLGKAGDAEEMQALDNLNANYALESISSLIYELDVCRDTCAALISGGDLSGALGELMGDMRTCAAEYYALGANSYSKLRALTEALDPCFEQMLDALDALEAGGEVGALDKLSNSIDGMSAALKMMY